MISAQFFHRQAQQTELEPGDLRGNYGNDLRDENRNISLILDPLPADPPSSSSNQNHKKSPSSSSSNQNHKKSPSFTDDHVLGLPNQEGGGEGAPAFLEVPGEEGGKKISFASKRGSSGSEKGGAGKPGMVMTSSEGIRMSSEVTRNSSEGDDDIMGGPAHVVLEARTWREKIFFTFSEPQFSLPARIINYYVTLLIIFSTATFCLQSLPALSSTSRQQATWSAMEAFVIANFTLEYVIRLLTCRQPVRFMLQPFNVIDLAAILPFYIELIVEATGGDAGGVSGLAVIRVIRLVRILRLLKLGKSSRKLRMVATAMARSKEGILLLLFMLTLSSVFFASFIFFAETASCYLDPRDGLYHYGNHTTKPDDVTPFQNIVVSMWWAIVTISTVGYGDYFPITGVGKLIGAATMISGLLVIAFPITIIGANLSAVYEEERQRREEREKRRQERKGRLEKEKKDPSGPFHPRPHV